MEDAKTLRASDVNALRDRIIGHVIIDIDARLLTQHLPIFVEDIEDTRLATCNEDTLVFGIDHQRSVRLEARRRPGCDHLLGVQVDDTNLLLVADIDVEAVVNVVDAHTLNVVARYRNLVDELALIDGKDRNSRVGQIGGGSAVANVIKSVGSVVVAGVGRIAMCGGGAVDELDAVEAMVVRS